MSSDLEWLIDHRIELNAYAFIERIGIILGDDAANPPADKLEAARKQAAGI